MTHNSIQHIVAVALNPAIDRILEVAGLSIGEHQHSRLLRRTAAGKATNVARNLSTFEIAADLTGLLGRGDHDFFAEDLKGTRVHLRMLPVAGHTRENITLIDPASRTETHLRDRGFEVSASELAAMKAELANLTSPETLFVFSGSLPPGIQPVDLAEMVTICRAAGGKVAVDASGPALGAAVQAGPWLIKPNRQELEELVGRPLPTGEELMAAGEELARGIPFVLVSCGAEGAYLFTSRERWHGWCEVEAGRIVSTVGCGDALLAGFVAGLYRNLEPVESLREGLASACATAISPTATFAGEPLEEFRRKVRVESRAD